MPRRRRNIALALLCFAVGLAAQQFSTTAATVLVGVAINLLSNLVENADLAPISRSMRFIRKYLTTGLPPFVSPSEANRPADSNPIWWRITVGALYAAMSLAGVAVGHSLDGPTYELVLIRGEEQQRLLRLDSEFSGHILHPIAHSYLDDVEWWDTYGAPRSGGRSHIGVDILGPKMTPVVAVKDAVVTWLRFDNDSGSIVRLRDEEGWQYQYIHLNNDAPGTDNGSASCIQVLAPRLCHAIAIGGDSATLGLTFESGELLGYIGDGGNAESTASHLHFEIYRLDSESGNVFSVNPTRYVDEARVPSLQDRLDSTLLGTGIEGAVVDTATTLNTVELKGTASSRSSLDRIIQEIRSLGNVAKVAVDEVSVDPAVPAGVDLLRYLGLDSITATVNRSDELIYSNTEMNALEPAVDALSEQTTTSVMVVGYDLPFGHTPTLNGPGYEAAILVTERLIEAGFNPQRITTSTLDMECPIYPDMTGGSMPDISVRILVVTNPTKPLAAQESNCL